MNVITLDNNTVHWNMKGGIVTNDVKPRSNFHIKARQLLTDIYPLGVVCEEVQIPIYRSQYLYFDFYLPLYDTAIEVHGQQHYKFIKHFHNHPMSFLKQRHNDAEKKEWCELNNITLIVPPYNEKIDDWRKRLTS